MSKSKDVLKNIGLSVLYKPIGIVISLVLIPLTIKYLGTTTFGLWSTILSIISWINYFDIGIGNGLRNHLTTEITAKDYKNSREYIMTAYGVVALISIVMLFLLSMLFKILNWNSIFNIEIYTNNELFFIMILNLIFILMNFILKIVATIYYSLQKSSTVGLIQILNQLFNLMGIYYLDMIGYSQNLLGISLVYGLAMALSNIIFTMILFKKNKELTPKISDFKIEKIKSLTALGMKFFVIQIAAMIIFTTDNMIITKLFGPEEVTPYNITFKVFSIIIMLHGIIITPLWSAITKAYTEKDMKWLKKVLLKLNQINIIIVAGIIILNLIFPFLIKVWIGDMVLIPQNMIYMFSVYTIITIFCNNYAYFFNGLGEINFQLKIAVIQAIINIPISIFFAKNLEMGSLGVILGTNVTLLLAAITYPFSLRRTLNKISKEK